MNDGHGFNSKTEQTKRNELRTTVFLVLPPEITKRLGPDSNNSTAPPTFEEATLHRLVRPLPRHLLRVTDQFSDDSVVRNYRGQADEQTRPLALHAGTRDLTNATNPSTGPNGKTT